MPAYDKKPDRNILSRAFKLTSFLLIVGVPAGLFFYQKNFDLFRIEAIKTEVSATDSMNTLSEEVKSKAARVTKDLQGKYLWQVDVSGIKKKMLEDRRIKTASVVRNWMGSLNLKMELHEPELLLAKGHGKWQIVSRDGSLLPENPKFIDLPILRGENFSRDVALRAKAQELIQLFPKDGMLSPKNISEIMYDSVEGFSVHLNDDSTVVRLGSEQFPLRLKLVERVASHLEKNDLQARVIDARFKQKVVVRLRNAP